MVTRRGPAAGPQRGEWVGIFDFRLARTFVAAVPGPAEPASCVS